MEKDFNINQLDKTTLEFVIKIAWQCESLCKNTKEGRTQAQAYNTIQETLQHYLKSNTSITEHQSRLSDF